MPVLNPYEAINLEVAEDETIQETWRAAVDGDNLPPMYTDHIVVQTAAAKGQTALGCGLYVDGVPTTKRDGLVGFWVYVLESPKRHLCAVIRKSRLCDCGCKGWCSYWVIFQWLHWNFVIMADGFHPGTDPLLNPITDPIRAAIIGEALLFTSALICINGIGWNTRQRLHFPLDPTKPLLATCAGVPRITCIPTKASMGLMRCGNCSG